MDAGLILTTRLEEGEEFKDEGRFSPLILEKSTPLTARRRLLCQFLIRGEGQGVGNNSRQN